MMLQLAFLLPFAFAFTEDIYLTVAFCPTPFEGAGAIVRVSPVNGSYTVVGRFAWPEKAVFGCVANYDPGVAFDSVDGRVMLDFVEDFGLLVEVDVKQASIATTVTPTDQFFVGYVNFVYQSNASIEGLSPTVTATGYCSDGCFELATMSTTGASKGTIKKLSNVPYRAIMDDTEWYDTTTNTFYTQGSYDLRSSDQWCGRSDADLCLIALDSNTGALKSSLYTNYTIYQYANISGPNGRLCWVEGFSDLCQHPYSDFLFADVDLSTAVATPRACIPRNITLDEAPWIGSFSLDGTLFVQGSGNADTGKIQVLVFDTTTGGVVVNTALDGLAEQLKAWQGLIWIWGADFYN